jgi:hypothetical protein
MIRLEGKRIGKELVEGIVGEHPLCQYCGVQFNVTRGALYLSGLRKFHPQ